MGDVKLDAGVSSFEWESWSDIAWLEVRDAFDMFATDKMSVVRMTNPMSARGHSVLVFIARHVDLWPTRRADSNDSARADAFDDQVGFKSNLDSAAREG